MTNSIETLSLSFPVDSVDCNCDVDICDPVARGGVICADCGTWYDVEIVPVMVACDATIAHVAIDEAHEALDSKLEFEALPFEMQDYIGTDYAW